jgi:hypothetical protein
VWWEPSFNSPDQTASQFVPGQTFDFYHSIYVVRIIKALSPAVWAVGVAILLLSPVEHGVRVNVQLQYTNKYQNILDSCVEEELRQPPVRCMRSRVILHVSNFKIRPRGSVMCASQLVRQVDSLKSNSYRADQDTSCRACASVGAVKLMTI